MIVVVGSLNMDFVVSVAHLPAPGETVLGRNFKTLPGGKGANQAVAAGRLAKGVMPVKMIGRVGEDVFGDQLKASLSAAGVDVSSVGASRGVPTGVALIAVDETGQNSIVVASGANGDLAPSEVKSMRQVFSGSKIVLFQLETPINTVRGALELARDQGLLTILDPAPAQDLPDEILRLVDILTPNEGECLQLLGMSPKERIALGDAASLAGRLRQRGPRTVILKLGERGCFVDDGASQRHHEGYAVDVVDTTAAGDTFNAALAVALAEGRKLEDAVPFANAAAALSVTRAGAQSSAPSRTEVDTLCSRVRS